ncbi:MAG: YfhO family protein [Acidobacteriota bacterium]
MKTSRVALVSFFFTLLFFIEYIPPFRQVHIPYDLEGFHHPLFEYVFQSLRHGQLPQWDPSMYGGMSPIANIQAAIFYPPTWLMYIASLGSQHLSYQAVQDLLLAHVWLAFMFCYLWLRGRGLMELPAALGAISFAYGGYMCTQLQHFGLVAGYAWFPLGLMSIDQAAQRYSWRPLWKLALASALCLLAGYPPTWFVFIVAVLTYASFKAPCVSAELDAEAAQHPTKWWKLPIGAALAIGGSLLLAMVQLLPTWEATRLLDPEPKYGGGVDLLALLHELLLPNFYDFGMNVPLGTNFGRSYFYLGSAGILGLCLIRRWRRIVPIFCMGAVCLFIAANPFGLVWAVVQHSDLLSSLCRDWYFLAGVTIALSGLAAHGLDDFLRREPRPLNWMGLGPWQRIALMVLVGGALYPKPFTVTVHGFVRANFLSGWSSSLNLAVVLAVMGLALYLYRHSRVPSAHALLILMLALFEYKTFGTSKRFDAAPGSGPHYSVDIPNQLGPDVYRQLLDHPEARVLLDDPSILPTALRTVGLASPQGFDPLLTSQFRRTVESLGPFKSDRSFDVDPTNDRALQTFAIRYAIANKASALSRSLAENPKFRAIVPAATSAYESPRLRVFEYLSATPAFGWEGADAARKIKLLSWKPSVREFDVESTSEGLLTLTEEFYPGWSAQISGAPADIERWNGAFQAVRVPAGAHTVKFEFHSRWLGIGSLVSLLSLVGLVFCWRADRRMPERLPLRSPLRNVTQ